MSVSSPWYVFVRAVVVGLGGAVLSLFVAQFPSPVSCMIFTGAIALIERRAMASASSPPARIGFTVLTWAVALSGLTLASVEGIHLVGVLEGRSIEAGVDAVRSNLELLLGRSRAPSPPSELILFVRVVFFPGFVAAGFGLTALRRLLETASGRAERMILFCLLTLASPPVVMIGIAIARTASLELVMIGSLFILLFNAFCVLCARYVVSELTRYADRVDAWLFGAGQESVAGGDENRTHLPGCSPGTEGLKP